MVIRLRSLLSISWIASSPRVGSYRSWSFSISFLVMVWFLRVILSSGLYKVVTPYHFIAIGIFRRCIIYKFPFLTRFGPVGTP